MSSNRSDRERPGEQLVVAEHSQLLRDRAARQVLLRTRFLLRSADKIRARADCRHRGRALTATWRGPYRGL
jgi:hypothetical protein